MSIKPVVLFVDDEERIVNLLRMIFRTVYQVEIATSGADALKIIESKHVDLIVSDQRMPGMLGIELLTEVRRRSPNTMRILLTGYSDLAAIVGSVNEAEVFRFINKPWDHDEIKLVVAEAVDIARKTAGIMAPSNKVALSELTKPSKKSEILVLDTADQNRAEIVNLLSQEYIVHVASSVPEALDKLKDYNIGVLMSEASLNGEDLSRFLSVLKQHYPVVATLILTSLSDADLVTKLINRAQIHRFLPKPIRPNVLMLAVSGAMKQHFHFVANPELMARNRVSVSKNNENEIFANSISKYLNAIRSKFSFFK